MRVCIPTETAEGLAAQVYGHFGSAPYFTIYDGEKDSVEVIENAGQHHSHGMCQPLQALEGRTIDAVVCGGMGARAVLMLNQGGIRAFRAHAGSVEQVINSYKEGRLEELTIENACTSHSCNH
jgi:predicted Fe-Mo cluster-binding NifX family protein